MADHVLPSVWQRPPPGHTPPSPPPSHWGEPRGGRARGRLGMEGGERGARGAAALAPYVTGFPPRGGRSARDVPGGGRDLPGRCQAPSPPRAPPRPPQPGRRLLPAGSRGSPGAALHNACVRVYMCVCECRGASPGPPSRRGRAAGAPLTPRPLLRGGGRSVPAPRCVM